jgi:hypothetical protein
MVAGCQPSRFTTQARAALLVIRNALTLWFVIPAVNLRFCSLLPLYTFSKTALIANGLNPY